MMNYGVLHLIRLRDQRPKLFQESVSDERNVSNMRKVFEFAEDSFKTWERVNRSVGGSVKPAEKTLWHSYLEHKKALGTLN